MDQLGPQQLKYMTVLRESSACFSLLSLLGGLKDVPDDKKRFCLEDESLRFRDFMVESHLLDPNCSFMPWSILIPPWYITLLMYLKLMPRISWIITFFLKKRDQIFGRKWPSSRDIYKTNKNMGWPEIKVETTGCVLSSSGLGTG